MATHLESCCSVSTLYLCGAGNGEGVRLALLVDRVSRRWGRIVLLDDDVAKHGSDRLGVPIIGGFDRLLDADPTTDEVVDLVTRTTVGRAAAREKIATYRIPFASLIHPEVELFGARIHDDVTIYANASIGAESTIATSCVVLTGAVVGHGTHLGQGCIIAPNAVINARVRVGERVYVGSNASILPDLSIGDGATIAGNTLVVSDVPAGATALGVPATIVRPPSTASTASNHHGSPSTAAGQDDIVDHDRDLLASDIAEVMCEVLERREVARTANFFDIGGTSLLAVRLGQQLRDQLGLSAGPLDLFEYPSVAALAEHFGGRHTTSPAMLSAQRRAARRRALIRH